MLLLLLALPFLGSLSFLFLPRERLGAKVPWLITLLTTLGCLIVLGYLTFTPPPQGGQWEFFHEWMPDIGLSLSFWLDGPALFFAWLVAGLGFLIFFYAGYYLDPKDSPWRFFGTMSLFMGSMLGVVISRNALLMFLFWELTSITSFILIGHWHEKASARAGALRALIVTGGGGLFLLAGIAGLFWIFKSSGVLEQDGISLGRALDWDVLWAHYKTLTGHSASIPIMILLLIGAFTKSAQFPFHYWLPGAMEAPTPVSAFLHAATMVKAGIYLLGRLYPIFWDVHLWLIIVGTVGVITMLIGGFMALTSYDIKQLLAHSTVSQLGLLTAYYGFGYGLVETGHKLPMDLLLVASHALFKGALFLLVGVIDHSTHTRDWRRLGGLRKTMPITAVLTIIGCASMAGVPLTFGFVAKELFLHASLEVHTSIGLLKMFFPVMAIFTSLFTVAYCCRTAISPFFGKLRDESLHPHEGGWGLLISPMIMIALCVAGGLYTPILEGPLSSLVNSGFYGVESGFNIAFFHHIDKLFAIAMFLFSVGFVVFLFSKKIDGVYRTLGSPGIFLGSYTWVFDKKIPAVAAWTARTMQSPSLQRNIAFTVSVFFVMVLLAAYHTGFNPNFHFEFNRQASQGLLLLVLMAVCLFVTIRHKSLLVKTIAFTPIGLFMALLFVLFKAPDLALTEILVDVVVLVVLLLILYKLPQRMKNTKESLAKPATATIAVVGGLVMASLCYVGMTSQIRDIPTFEGQPAVHDYYLQNTKHPYTEHFEGDKAEIANYPGADHPHGGGGNNTVNVILVDFRGIDTMGEISVLSLASIGVFCLFAMGRVPKGKDDPRRKKAQQALAKVNFGDGEMEPGKPVIPYATWKSPSLIFREVCRIVPAFILVFSVVLFFAGHNAPGGGFIAGLMTSVALATLYISFDRRQIQSIRKFSFIKLIPIGLALAILTGGAAVLFGYPFLTSAHIEPLLPILGEVGLASAALFDLGVYLVVVGATMLVLEYLGRE